MPVTDQRIDRYIQQSEPFAIPILTHLRKLIHTACPMATETIKWSFPHFLYNGKTLCSMASFKHHCAFTFWLGSLMKDPEGIFNTESENAAMGQLGQIKSKADLPPDKVLASYLKEAMQLMDEGAKLPKKQAPADRTVVVPDYFLAELKTNKTAQANFEAFPYSHKKEYVEWITEAKTEVTRQKRMATAIEWIGEGKGRNWKYESK